MDAQSLPHPQVDFPAFAKAISVLNDKEPSVWNPATGKLSKWIDMKKLTAVYKGSGGHGGGVGGGKGGKSSSKGTDLGAACCTIA